MLTVLADEFGYELGRDALNRDPNYRGLLASAEYEAWLASRQ